VGQVISCDDVHALQKRINGYRTDLATSIDLLNSPGLYSKETDKYEPRPLGNLGPRSAVAWRDVMDRCNQFEEEACVVGLFASKQFDRGRDLVTELDGWRDYLATIQAPSLPTPVEVPHSSLDLLGAAGWGLAALIVLLLVREFK
jgi:hypothetical protein